MSRAGRQGSLYRMSYVQPDPASRHVHLSSSAPASVNRGYYKILTPVKVSGRREDLEATRPPLLGTGFAIAVDDAANLIGHPVDLPLSLRIRWCPGLRVLQHLPVAGRGAENGVRPAPGIPRSSPTFPILENPVASTEISGYPPDIARPRRPTRRPRRAMRYCSNAKIRFQSFFMLITTQPCVFASS